MIRPLMIARSPASYVSKSVNAVEQLLPAVDAELAVDAVAVRDGSALRYEQLLLHLAQAVSSCEDDEDLALALGESSESESSLQQATKLAFSSGMAPCAS